MNKLKHPLDKNGVATLLFLEETFQKNFEAKKIVK